MPCQTDKLASGFSTRTLTPSRPLLAVVGVPVWELLSGGGEKKKSFQFTEPSHWRPLNHRTLRVCCRRPRRIFGGCALHGYAGTDGNWLCGRGGSEEEEEEVGCVCVCAVTAAAGGSSHQQRQADNKIRQNAAHQTSCLHGGDRSPYFGHALMLCCVWSFEEAATVCLYLSVLL